MRLEQLLVEAKATICAAVRVSRTDIQAAKAFVSRNSDADMQTTLKQWQAYQECEVHKGYEIKVAGDGRADAEFERVARALSARLSFAHGVRDLVQNGFLLDLGPADWASTALTIHVTITPVAASGGGTRSLNFDQFVAYYPSKVHRATWLEHDRLGDPDLYLGMVALEGLASGIEQALRDAVQCFRHGLLTPCVAMLFSAVEGCWIELGIRLGGEIAEQIKSSRDSIFKKIGKVTEAVQKRGIDKWRSEQLLVTKEWTDLLRRSRNAVHYDACAPTPNDYDKVAHLMLSAPGHLRFLRDLA